MKQRVQWGLRNPFLGQIFIRKWMNGMFLNPNKCHNLRVWTIFSLPQWKVRRISSWNFVEKISRPSKSPIPWERRISSQRDIEKSIFSLALFRFEEKWEKFPNSLNFPGKNSCWFRQRKNILWKSDFRSKSQFLLVQNLASGKQSYPCNFGLMLQDLRMHEEVVVPRTKKQCVSFFLRFNRIFWMTLRLFLTLEFVNKTPRRKRNELQSWTGNVNVILKHGKGVSTPVYVK